MKELKKAIEWYMTLNKEEQENIAILVDLWDLVTNFFWETKNANKNNGN